MPPCPQTIVSIQRLYGAQALNTFGQRAAVGTLTGVTISTPLGAVGAGLSNLRALVRGEITPTQYLEQIGWGMLQSATFGAAFGFLGAALSRRPTTALSRPSPAGGGGAVEPDFVISPVRVNPQTGAISQMAFHRPTGQYYVAEYNPITGTGQVINQSSGLQVATFFNGRFYPPMAALQAPGQPGAGPTAAPPPAGVPMGPPGLIPGGMAAGLRGPLTLPGPAALPGLPVGPPGVTAVAPLTLPSQVISGPPIGTVSPAQTPVWVNTRSGVYPAGAQTVGLAEE